MKTKKAVKKQVQPTATVYPNPAALVTSRGNDGQTNIFTAAWVSTVAMDPPHLGIAVRPVRYSFSLMQESGEFGVNLPGSEMVKKVDLCGNTSGRDLDKWELTGLTKKDPSVISAPLIEECPVNIECRIINSIEVGTHFWVIGRVVARHENEGFSPVELLSYVSPDYRDIGANKLGSYGFSRR